MVDVYRGEEIRVLTRQSNGNSYGVTLPDEFLNYRFREDSYVAVSICQEEVYGQNVSYIEGFLAIENRGKYCRKVQAGTGAHPTRKIGIPKDWTDDGRFDVKEHDDIIIEISDEYLRIFKQEDYGFVSEPGGLLAQDRSETQIKYESWLEDNKPTQKFQIIPINGYDDIFLENFELEKLPDIATIPTFGPEQFDEIKKKHSLPVESVDLVLVKWNPKASVRRRAGLRDTGEIIHVERDVEQLEIKLPKSGIFEIKALDLDGSSLDRQRSVIKRAWLAYWPSEDMDHPYEVNTLGDSWLAAYFDDSEDQEFLSIYLMPWNDKRGDRIGCSWHYYCFFDTSMLDLSQYPYIFKSSK